MSKGGLDLKNARNTSLDILRIFAMFTVILLHVLGTQFFSLQDVNTIWWAKLNLLDAGTRWCVPIFVMISGALFLNPDKQINLKQLYSKYILHILEAFLVWSVVYTAIDMIAMNYATTMDLKHVLMEFLITVLLKPHYHLWYLYLIIGLYAITPMLRSIVKNSDRKILKYWIALMFLVGICVYFLNDFEKINFYIGKAVGNANLQFLCGFTFYFVVGYYVLNYKICHQNVIYSLGILGYIFTVVVSQWLSHRARTNVVIYDYLYPNIALTAVAIFVFFVKKIDKIKFSDKIKLNLKKVSDMMFGVYLIHDLFIMLFSRYGLLIERVHSLIWTIIVSMIILSVSCIFVWILRKIPILRKIT